MKIILTACICLLMLTACICLLMACNNGAAYNASSNAPDTSPFIAAVKMPDTTTLGGGWYLQPVLASDTASGKTPVLFFDVPKTHFSGNTGCNPMNGTFWYSDKDSSLSFSDKIVSARMTCTGYNETAFVKSLTQVNHYRLDKGMLILLTDNTELSRWARRPVVPPRSVKA